MSRLGLGFCCRIRTGDWIVPRARGLLNGNDVRATTDRHSPASKESAFTDKQDLGDLEMLPVQLASLSDRLQRPVAVRIAPPSLSKSLLPGCHLARRLLDSDQNELKDPYLFIRFPPPSLARLPAQFLLPLDKRERPIEENSLFSVAASLFNAQNIIAARSRATLGERNINFLYGRIHLSREKSNFISPLW
jgi:hypothetical protein